MGHKKSIGLPGGPNEFLQDITQYISVEGYKNDSPDKNNPVNIIESSNITMEGVDFPVRGYGNNGIVQDMKPGRTNYNYEDADYVVEIPMAQDGDETSSDLEKEIDGLDLSKYNVRVIQYPYGSKKFSPGHIESVLIDKKTGRQVNKISGTKLVGYINRWAGPGNRRVTQGDYEREEDVRTVDLNLSESEIKNFITEAQLFTGTNKGKEHSKSGLNVRKLPLSINDDDIYNYDFIDSNCATGVCMGLGMDPNSPENTQAGITDPNLVMDGILSKYNDFIVPGSSTGYRTSREDGLKNLVKDNLGENVNAGTIDVLTNYLDGLNRDDINNTLESILQNPTALKILKNDGDLSNIGDRAFRDLTSIFNSYNPFVDVGRGREEMAWRNINNIRKDVGNIYESIPEGTIPAALEALNKQYIEPNNPFDVSLEGVKNIPGWWKNKLGFKEGGSTSWNWKGKSYSGTLIPSMETETNRYARTENGKIKTLPKAQDGLPFGVKSQPFSDVYVPNIQWAENVQGLEWAKDKQQGMNVSGVNLSKDFNLGKNTSLSVSNPAFVHAKPMVDGTQFGEANKFFPLDPKVTLRYTFNEGGSLPKAQYGLKDGEGSSYKEILGNAEDSLDEWLGYSMNGVRGIDQVLTKEQMDYYDSFQQDIRQREAAIYDDIDKKNIPYGSKNWTPIDMDPRMIALREEQIKFNEDNPIYNETQDLLWEASDPIRHSTSSANTSKALQQKVRDVPYIGGLLDFLGVDNAVGFVGANALGIGHEAMTLPDDKRDWATKLKESGQDIYNNFKGSLEGNKNLNSRDTINNLLEQYKLGNLADGTVMTPEQEAQLEQIKFNEAEDERRLKQMVAGTLAPSGDGEPQMGFEVIDPMQEGGCTSCTESMRQREGSYNKGKEYILDPRFKQEGGSTTNPYTIYMNYINGIDESEVAQNIFDKLNRMHYRDAKTRGMGVANYIASNIIPNS